MLLLKIIIITFITIIIVFFMVAVGFSAGIIRGLKIMSIKDLKRTSFEDVVIKKIFTDVENVDPFFYSLYLKDQRKKETEDFKTKLADLQSQIEETSNPNFIVESVKKKKIKNKKRNVKK